MLLIEIVQRVSSPYLVGQLIGVTKFITPVGIVTLNQICTGHEALDDEKDSHPPHNFNYVSGNSGPEPRC
jgi:hypothetical protein